MVGRRSNHERHRGRTPRRIHPRDPQRRTGLGRGGAGAPGRAARGPGGAGRSGRSRRSPRRSLRRSPRSPSRPAGRRRRASPAPGRLPALPARRRPPTVRRALRPTRVSPHAAPQYASAFGQAGRPDANQTQPTVPFDRTATGAVATATAPKKKSGAGKVVGLIVAAAIVGGAAGLGGAYAGVNLFTPAGTSPAAGPVDRHGEQHRLRQPDHRDRGEGAPERRHDRGDGHQRRRHRLRRRAHQRRLRRDEHARRDPRRRRPPTPRSA